MADLPQNLQEQIKEFEETFTVDTDVLKKVVDHFVKELEKGVYYLEGRLEGREWIRRRRRRRS